jgi:Ni2+-binding GTPase involved in maturation of urease and hydrogenase
MGVRKQKQLIMFMLGAGGSGKTKVINAIMAYAKGFCKELNYMFDKRMIVVTALTGVAATLINGETTHSTAKLNYKNITSEHIDEWQKAHLLIIDEISRLITDTTTIDENISDSVRNQNKCISNKS